MILKHGHGEVCFRWRTQGQGLPDESIVSAGRGQFGWEEVTADG